jgi:hypothetical protein
VLKALGKEHQPGRVRVLLRLEELRRLAQTELDLEQRDVARDRRSREGANQRVGECRRYLALADPVPLDLAIGRPGVLAQRGLPKIAEKWPLGVTNDDPAEREELPLG